MSGFHAATSEQIHSHKKRGADAEDMRIAQHEEHVARSKNMGSTMPVAKANKVQSCRNAFQSPNPPDARRETKGKMIVGPM